MNDGNGGIRYTTETPPLKHKYLRDHKIIEVIENYKYCIGKDIGRMETVLEGQSLNPYTSWADEKNAE